MGGRSARHSRAAEDGGVAPPPPEPEPPQEAQEPATDVEDEVAQQRPQRHADLPPPADGRCLLEALPNAVLVTVCSYLSHEWRALERHARLCRGFRDRFDDDAVWRQLCADYWLVDEEGFERWPKISTWRALYRTLEQWAVLEGFYTLPSAFPWCLLVVLRFESGSLVAEAVRFCHSAAEGTDDGRPSEVCARLFEISFSEEADGVRASLRFGAGALAGRAAVVGPLAAQVASQLPWGQRFRSRDAVLPKYMNAHRGLSVVLTEDGDDAPKELGLWTPEIDATDEAGLRETTARMVQQLAGAAGSLDLAMVRSPTEDVLDDPLIEQLRPGLYVGNYGHDFYGQFRWEVLHVEFREYALANISDLFARPFGDGNPPGKLMEALTGGAERAGFLVGTKVTGDFHVPAGQATFVAMVTPSVSKNLLVGTRDMVVLARVDAQRTSPFLCRKWLPEGLR